MSRDKGTSQVSHTNCRSVAKIMDKTCGDHVFPCKVQLVLHLLPIVPKTPCITEISIAACDGFQ
jgi:hypothetical protein